MVKISPLIASMLLGLAAALPQQGAPSGTGGFGSGPKPTGTDVAFPSGTGGFGGPQPSGGFGGAQASGFGGPQPTGGFGGAQPTGGFGGVAGNAQQSGAPFQSGGPRPTGGTYS